MTDDTPCEQCGSSGCECSCPSPESLQEVAAALRAAIPEAEVAARASAPTTPDPETDWELYFARKAQFLKEQRNEARAERDAYKAAWAELEASIKNDDEQVSPLLRLHFFAAKYGLDETKP